MVNSATGLLHGTYRRKQAANLPFRAEIAVHFGGSVEVSVGYFWFSASGTCSVRLVSSRFKQQ
jgi:hypothetical protein